MSANSVLPPTDGIRRADSSEYLGLSEFLCVGHTMTARSQYAETEEPGAAGKPP